VFGEDKKAGGGQGRGGEGDASHPEGGGISNIARNEKREREKEQSKHNGGGEKRKNSSSEQR